MSGVGEPESPSGTELNRSAAWRLTQLLGALASSSHGLGVRETAREIGVDKSAVNRMLSQLHDLGYAKRDKRTGQYSVGPAMFALGATIVARDNLTEAAAPILRNLTNEFDETTYLGVREADRISYRLRIDCHRTIRHVIELGYTAPFHAGAAGRAVLSGMTEIELKECLDAIELKPITQQTITELPKLLDAVALDRSRGYSFTQGEVSKGGTAIAAPFFDAFGLCAGAVVFSRPTERHSLEDMEAIVDAVKDAASLLTKRIGGRNDSQTAV